MRRTNRALTILAAAALAVGGCAAAPPAGERRASRMALLDRWATAVPASEAQRCGARFLEGHSGWRRSGPLGPDPGRTAHLPAAPPGTEPLGFRQRFELTTDGGRVLDDDVDCVFLATPSSIAFESASPSRREAEATAASRSAARAIYRGVFLGR